jgi:hypothetical protein
VSGLSPGCTSVRVCLHSRGADSVCRRFKGWTSYSGAAAEALGAYALSGQADVPSLSVSLGLSDISALVTIALQEATISISTLLSNCAEAQRTYLAVLSQFRAALKDVLAREADIRVILRDREILVGRLAKLSSKRPNENSIEVHQAKLDEAKTELAACDATLKNDEWALVGIKTTVLKKAWVDRLRALGEMARVFDDSSRAGLEVLERVDDPYQDEPDGQTFSPFLYDTASYRLSLDTAFYPSIGPRERQGTSNSSSIAPSQSASQPAYNSDSEEDFDVHLPAPHALRDYSADFQIPHASIVRREPVTSPPGLQTRSNGHAHPGDHAPPLPRKEEPAPVQEESSSEEEDESRFVAHTGGGANLGVSSADLHRVGPAVPSNPSRQTSSPPPPQLPTIRTDLRQAPSEASSVMSGGKRRSTHGFFASLFKRKSKEHLDSPRGSRENLPGSKWATRTERHLATNRGTREDGSSDEEPDPRNLIKVVNEKPELWQANGRLSKSKSFKGRTATAEPAPSPAKSVGGGDEPKRLRRKSTRRRTLSDSAAAGGLAQRQSIEGRLADTPPGATSSGLSRGGTVRSVLSVASDATATSKGTTSTPKRRPASTAVIQNDGNRITLAKSTRKHQSLMGIVESPYPPRTPLAVTTTTTGEQPQVAVVSPSPAGPADKTSRSYESRSSTAVVAPDSSGLSVPIMSSSSPSSSQSGQPVEMAKSSSGSTVRSFAPSVAGDDEWQDALEDLTPIQEITDDDDEQRSATPIANSNNVVVFHTTTVAAPQPVRGTSSAAMGQAHHHPTLGVVLPRSALVHRNPSPAPSSTLSSGTTTTTTRPKSVRLAADVKPDNSEAQNHLHLHAHFAPPSGSRSGSGRSGSGRVVAGKAGGGGGSGGGEEEGEGWSTRVGRRREQDDSSDEEAAREYTKARRAMMSGVGLGGGSKKKEKAKATG